MGMNSEIDVAGFINGYMTAMKEMGKSVNKEHLKAIALEYMDEEDNQYYASVIDHMIKTVYKEDGITKHNDGRL